MVHNNFSFNNKILMDNKTLRDSNITFHSTLNMVLRLRGNLQKETNQDEIEDKPKQISTRSNFNPLANFTPSAITDSNGKVRIPVTVPGKENAHN